MFSSSKLVNAVAQRLLDTIEQGRWVAGQMLPGQRELAEQMEISRPSLREAIMVLETLGVVRSLPGKGVMVLERSEPLREVAAPGEATMEDVLQLRYALEPFIVGIVAQSAGAAEISELRLLLLRAIYRFLVDLREQRLMAPCLRNRGTRRLLREVSGLLGEAVTDADVDAFMELEARLRSRASGQDEAASLRHIKRVMALPQRSGSCPGSSESSWCQASMPRQFRRK